MQYGDTYFLTRRNKWVFSGLGFFPEERGMLFELNGLVWNWPVYMIRVVGYCLNVTHIL